MITLNLLAISVKSTIRNLIPAFLYSLLGFVVMCLVGFLVCAFIGRHVQRSFTSAFGPHYQAVIGGCGAYLHEAFILLTALLTGHSLKMAHFKTLYNIKHGLKLGNVDHLWGQHSIWSHCFEFLLGALPYYLMTALVIFIQFIFGGNPLPQNILQQPIIAYKSVHTWISMFFSSFANDFSLSAILFIPFVIVLILLFASGFNFSQAETDTAVSGVMAWAFLDIVIAFVCTILSFGTFVNIFSVVAFNIFAWLMFKILWYLLIMWGILLIFVIINKSVSVGSKVNKLRK